MNPADQLERDMEIIESVARAALPRAQQVGMTLDDLRSIGYDVHEDETGYGKRLHGAALKQRFWDRIKRGIPAWAKLNYHYGTPLKGEGPKYTDARLPRPNSINPPADSRCDIEAIGNVQVMMFAQTCAHHPYHEIDAADRERSRERIRLLQERERPRRLPARAA